jgi:hypothetical protein
VTTLVEPRVQARRAVEALRSGVPSRDAVAALGCSQDDVEDRVLALLQRTGDGRRAETGRDRGVLLGGGFGSGKSHLLEHLAHLALDAGWAVSRIVVSKETPLHDPAKVFRTAVESAVLPAAGPGSVVAEAAAGLDVEAASYAELLRWASSTASGLDERFPATVTLYPRLREREEEAAETILRFWSGDPLRVSDLRRWLRAAGEGRPRLAAVPVRELSRQRFRFLARLLVAAGHRGWLLLFDEVELIGRYGPTSRARSYGELAGWLRAGPGDGDVPLATVLAMTDDFEAAVLAGKDDRTALPRRLRDKESPDLDLLAGEAEAGMRLIERSLVRLAPPDARELDEVYARLKALHGEAFGWAPPDVPGLEQLGATQIRQYVRAWINEWDLVRLDPEFRPQTTVATVDSNYRELPELADPTDPDLD